MKNILIVASFLALSGTAQATVVTATCNPNPNPILGQSGSGNENCSFGVSLTGATINSITYEYIFDFQFNQFNQGTKTVAFSFTGPGNAAFSGTATTANRPVDSGVLNVTAGNYALFTGANFTIGDSYTGASTAITGATFSKNFVLNYTPSAVPEPMTYTMLAVGLGFIALRRRS